MAAATKEGKEKWSGCTQSGKARRRAPDTAQMCLNARSSIPAAAAAAAMRKPSGMDGRNVNARPQSYPRGAAHRARSLEHTAESNNHGAESIEHGTQTTEHGAQDRAPSTEHREHGARNTVHGAESTNHRAESTEFGCHCTFHIVLVFEVPWMLFGAS